MVLPSSLLRVIFTARIVLTIYHPLLLIPKEPPSDDYLQVSVNPRVRDLWQFNTCSLCLSHRTLYRTHRRPTCTVTRSDFSSTNCNLPALVRSKYRNCTEFQHPSVYGAVHAALGLSMTVPFARTYYLLQDLIRRGLWVADVSIVGLVSLAPRASAGIDEEGECVLSDGADML